MDSYCMSGFKSARIQVCSECPDAIRFVLQVQLTLLTAIVKLFLKKPSETQELVQQVLSLATQVRLVNYFMTA